MTHSPNITKSPDDDDDYLDGEDVRCLGMWRVGHEPFFPREFVASRKQRKPPKATIERIAKDARKAGIDVARYELKPDGTVVVVIGKPEPVEPGAWPL